MNAREIVKALAGQWRGNTGTALCPAHEDHRPSLSVSLGDDGKVLVHCHAGCSQQTVLNALAARGIHLAGPRQIRKASNTPVIDRTYDYVGSDGQTLFQVVRYKPKGFRQRRPDGHGGWIWNLRGIKPVPYHLPDLLECNAQQVFIVEGEKDADALRNLGMLATCNPGGAGRWRQDFHRYFVGRDVVVLPDNDERGRKHADQIVANLRPVARRLRILALPGLSPKGDPHDWIQSGGTAQELLRLAKTTPDVGTTLASATDDWYAKCLTGSRGGVLSNHANVLLALRSDPAWLDVLAYDEMREQVMLLRAAPVHGRPPSPPHKEPRPWTDIEDAAAQEWLQIAGLPGVGRETVATAVSQRSRELSYHPLRDWLNELKWDGIPRVEGGTTPGGEILEPWLSTYFGAPNTTYTQAIGTMWLVSAVARVLEPGCKVDHMLILEGDQGTGKSAACRILCGECYFSDTLPEIGSKDAKAHLSGKWIVELAELDALLRAEPSSTKAFLTQQIDRFRPAYARRDVDSPRQCVFVGTTNQKQYLKDETGGRRFWPVQTGVIDLPSLSTDRVQLWAEAVHLYRRGRKWHITDSDLLKVADAEQSARFDIDAWEEPIAEYLEDKPEVTIGQVMREALYIETPRMERRAQNRVKRILTHLGWRRGSRHKQGQLWMKAGSIG